MMIEAIHSDLPIPPGEYLEEVIEELGMTKDELARRMDRPASKLNMIFKGRKAITPDTALQLEKVVGVPAHIWTGLEAEYRLALARQQNEQERARLEEETALLKPFCYSTLAKMGVVPKTAKPIEKVLALQKFFGVTSLRNVLNVRRYAAAFRFGSGGTQRSPEAVAAWLRFGEVKAREIPARPFDKRKIKESLSEFRRLTATSPETAIRRLRERLAEAGVAVVVCPCFPKTRAHGATFWLGREKAVLLLTNRYKWADIFWFSLFHELGHIVLHRRDAVFLETDGDDTVSAVQEQAADRFAADTLIPREDWDRFAQRGSFSHASVCAFARQIGVAPGIVVGRLQHENIVRRSWGNGLRVKYEWGGE